MKLLHVCLAAGMLLGCSPVGDPYAPLAGEEEVAARSIEGTYIVTYVDEEPPLINIAGHEPTLSISADRIHFQSQCIYDDWSYEVEGESLTTGEWDYGELVAQCSRSLAPGEEAIIAVLDQADTVRFVAHGLWISGEGGTMQMRFVPSEADLASRDVDLSGSWLVQEIDGATVPFPLELEADFTHIWWEPGCAGQGRAYSIADATFSTIPPADGPREVCAIGYPDELTQVWQVMDAADTVEPAANGSVLIAGGGRSLTMQRR